MATVLLAVGDSALGEACRAQLEAAGHAVLALERPLASLALAARVLWDAALVDGSALGDETVAVLTAAGLKQPVIGLGRQGAGLTAALPLPLAERELLSLTAKLTAGSAAPPPDRLRLDPLRRLVLAEGGGAELTRTEYRLLALLYEQSPREVPLAALLQAVWGSTEGKRAPDMVRAHVRSLRRKLAGLGLHDVLRARRGRGYALVL